MQEKNITRIVADTNVLVSILAAKSLKPLLTLWETEKFKLVFSKETFQELDWVLKRPKFDRWASLEKRELFIKSLAGVSEEVRPTLKLNDCRDADDNIFLECAVTGKVDYIVSGDSDLLVLNPYHGIQIISPSKFVEILSS